MSITSSRPPKPAPPNLSTTRQQKLRASLPNGDRLSRHGRSPATCRKKSEFTYRKFTHRKFTRHKFTHHLAERPTCCSRRDKHAANCTTVHNRGHRFKRRARDEYRDRAHGKNKNRRDGRTQGFRCHRYAADSKQAGTDGALRSAGSKPDLESGAKRNAKPNAKSGAKSDLKSGAKSDTRRPTTASGNDASKPCLLVDNLDSGYARRRNHRWSGRVVDVRFWLGAHDPCQPRTGSPYPVFAVRTTSLTVVAAFIPGG